MTRRAMSAFAPALRISTDSRPSTGRETAMQHEPTYPILERIATAMMVLNVAGLIALFAAWYDPPLTQHASARPTLAQD
jgi:hypothetical protein